MTDGDMLLQSILAAPADDTARLIYADWLQENGQEERAEFIRVQVELAQMNPPRVIDARLMSRYGHDVTAQAQLPLTDVPSVGDVVDVAQRHGHGAITTIIGAMIRSANVMLSLGGLPAWEIHLLNDRDYYPDRLRLRELESRERVLWDMQRIPGVWAVYPSGLFPGAHHHCLPTDAMAGASAEGDRTRLPIVIYRRGFPESITCTTADWIAHAAVIRREHPITSVRLTAFPMLPCRDDESPETVARNTLAHYYPGIAFELPFFSLVHHSELPAVVGESPGRAALDEGVRLPRIITDAAIRR